MPQSCQVTKQPKLCKISEFNVDRDRGRREKLISKEVARVEKRHLTARQVLNIYGTKNILIVLLYGKTIENYVNRSFINISACDLN